MGDGSAVDPIPITDQVARSFSPRERLCDLARNPFRGRMGCDIHPDNFSALQSNDDEDIEQVKTNGRGNEQVDRAMSGAWLRRKVRHPGEGGPHRLTIYFATLD